MTRAEGPELEPVISDAASGMAGPQLPVSGRIVTRLDAGGRMEFCFESEAGELICPKARFLSLERVRTDRWIPTSEFSWEVPVVPESLITPNVSVQDVEPVSERGSCTPDFERMMAATWRVETLRGRGSAFHIGNGRFLTAHHVIDGVPPFVTLTHEELAMPAAVLGSDPTVDLALLEVYDKTLVEGIPVTELRVPTQDDVGSETFLVGYPGGNALSVSFGGIITRVWEDEIQSSSRAFGGNSGGPMFDACGDALGVLWAGTGLRTLSHSGRTLISALAVLEPKWPPLPKELPHGLDQLPDVLIWHYGAEPPPEVDCSGLDSDIWVGVAGGRDRYFGIELNGWSSEDCSRGRTRVIGFKSNPHYRDRTFNDACLFHFDPDSPLHKEIDPGRSPVVLHESVEPYGTLRLVQLHQDGYCPGEYTHELVVELVPPLSSEFNFESTIEQANGTSYRGLSAGYRTYGSNDEPGAPHAKYIQRFRIPADAEFDGIRLSHRDQSWRTGIRQPKAQTMALVQRAKIAVLVESEGGAVRLCLLPEGEQRVCHAERLNPGSLDRDGWREMPRLRWLVRAPATHLKREGVLSNPYSCGLTPRVGYQVWQLRTYRAANTAVYVGQGQFLGIASAFSETVPWGVVSRGDTALPVAVVARDRRSNLALLEVVGRSAENALGVPVSFDQVTDEDRGRYLLMVQALWGGTDRFSAVRGRIDGVGSRSFSFATKSSDPLHVYPGTPLVDGCSYQMVGIHMESGVLDAGTIAESLSELRSQRQPPQQASDGPMFSGSAALLQHPVHVITDQPDIVEGVICNVRRSERYNVVYAVYLSKFEDPSVIQVTDGKSSAAATCGYPGKVFIVEYRADQVPDVFCAEPVRPDYPQSDLMLKLEAPAGVRMVQASQFRREPCPGLVDTETRREDWSSDFFIALRVTEPVSLDKVHVTFQDKSGQRLAAVLRRVKGDVDPDVLEWRVQMVDDAAPVKVVVTVEQEDEDSS